MINADENFALRPWQPEDAAAAFEFYGDPAVSKHIGNGLPAKDVAQVEKTLRLFIEHQQEKGFSPWAIIEKKTAKIIGINGIHTFNESKEPELGFRI